MSETQQFPWRGFGYERVYAKPYVRQFRTARQKMLRFFKGRPEFTEFADRLNALRKNPRLTGPEKHAAFQEILNDYIKFVTPRPATEVLSEAEAMAAGGSLALQSESVADDGTLDTSGVRDDADASVRHVEMENSDLA